MNTKPAFPGSRIVRYVGTAKNAGFTLIELMVVVAIIAILSMLAAPGMRDLLASNRASSTAALFANALNQARAEAIQRSASVIFCASNDPTATTPSCASDWTKGWMIFVDTDGSGGFTTGDVMIRMWQSPTSASITSTSTVTTLMQFSLRGALSNNSNGTYTICSAPKSRAVTLSSIGRTAVSTTEGSC